MVARQSQDVEAGLGHSIQRGGSGCGGRDIGGGALPVLGMGNLQMPHQDIGLVQGCADLTEQLGAVLTFEHQVSCCAEQRHDRS